MEGGVGFAADAERAGNLVGENGELHPPGILRVETASNFAGNRVVVVNDLLLSHIGAGILATEKKGATPRAGWF